MEPIATKRSLGLYSLLLACLALACVAIYQWIELRRLRSEELGRVIAVRVIQSICDDETRAAWGYYLEALAGSKNPTHGYYEFDGGLRVTASRKECAFYFTDKTDPDARQRLMNTIAPKIITGSGLLLPRIEEEWHSLSQSAAGGGEEKKSRFVDDANTGYPMSVYLRHRPEGNCIMIRGDTLLGK